jgi:alpha-beta hydrolase superfamily lysophospholipase
VEDRSFVDVHGVEVRTRWWPVDDPHGVVLLSHGASEHVGRYDRFAEALNAAGYFVAGLDHRGHGRTGPAPGIMGPGGGAALLDDLHALREQAVQGVGGDAPVFLFAHSMGTLIGLAYLTTRADGLAGAVLCGVPVDVDDAAAIGPLLAGFDDAGMRDEPAADLFGDPSVASQPAETRFAWLSRDPVEVDRYVADPLCGDGNPLTYGYLIDLFELVAPARDRVAEIPCPVLVISGEDDPAAAAGANPKALSDALGGAGVDQQLALYPGARHELLNDTNRDEVTADIIDWLRSTDPS